MPTANQIKLRIRKPYKTSSCEREEEMKDTQTNAATFPGRQIGLITCTRKKKAHPCQARELYSESPKFVRHLEFAEAHYQKVFVVSARHGLVFPNQILAPYDCYLGDFTHDEKAGWAAFVAACLRHEGMRAGDTVHIHSDEMYCEHLTLSLAPYQVTLRFSNFDADPASGVLVPVPRSVLNPLAAECYSAIEERLSVLEKLVLKLESRVETTAPPPNPWGPVKWEMCGKCDGEGHFANPDISPINRK